MLAWQLVGASRRPQSVTPQTEWLCARREFRLADDMYAQDSIELLKLSGINFAETEARGIDVHAFGELLMSSGIVLNEEVRTAPAAQHCLRARVLIAGSTRRALRMFQQQAQRCRGCLRRESTAASEVTAEWPQRQPPMRLLILAQVRWITFHSGYDFGYLLKVLTCQPLPATEPEFFELLKVSDSAWLLQLRRSFSPVRGGSPQSCAPAAEPACVAQRNNRQPETKQTHGSISQLLLSPLHSTARSRARVLTRNVVAVKCGAVPRRSTSPPCTTSST